MSAEGTGDRPGEGPSEARRAPARDAEARLVTLVHDLRTPLTVVCGFVDLLEARGEELTPEQRTEFVARAAAGARELRAILDAERAAP